MNFHNQLKRHIKTKCTEIPEDVLESFLSEINEKISDFISNEKNKEKLLRESALELSNYSQIYNFLKTDISYDDFLRYKSIDWSNVRPCSDSPIWDLKMNLIRACKNGDAITFISCLNTILGNCCISTIDDLD